MFDCDPLISNIYTKMFVDTSSAAHFLKIDGCWFDLTSALKEDRPPRRNITYKTVGTIKHLNTISRCGTDDCRSGLPFLLMGLFYSISSCVFKTPVQNQPVTSLFHSYCGDTPSCQHASSTTLRRHDFFFPFLSSIMTPAFHEACAIPTRLPIDLPLIDRT